MAKKKQEKDPMPTSHIRFPQDLASKLNAMASIQQESIAVLCDRLFRQIVVNEHRNTLRHELEQTETIKKK